MCSGMCTRTLERVEGEKEEGRGERTQERSDREGINHTDVSAQSLARGLGPPLSSWFFSILASLFSPLPPNDTKDYDATCSGDLRETQVCWRWDGS